MLGMPTATQKEVNLLTPVMISRADLLASHEPVRHYYTHGSSLVQLPPQPAEPPRDGGLIIDMPLDGIKEYLSPMIVLDELASDEDLVTQLHQSSQMSAPPHSKAAGQAAYRLENALTSSAVFDRLDEDTQSRVLARLHETGAHTRLNKRESFTQSNELLLHQRVRELDPSEPESAATAEWLTARVNLAKCRLNKRQLKQYEKEGRVLHHHMQGVAPKVIAAKLQVTPTFINNTLGVVRKKGKELLAFDGVPTEVITQEL